MNNYKVGIIRHNIKDMLRVVRDCRLAINYGKPTIQNTLETLSNVSDSLSYCLDMLNSNLNESEVDVNADTLKAYDTLLTTKRAEFIALCNLIERKKTELGTLSAKTERLRRNAEITYIAITDKQLEDLKNQLKGE